MSAMQNFGPLAVIFGEKSAITHQLEIQLENARIKVKHHENTSPLPSEATYVFYVLPSGIQSEINSAKIVNQISAIAEVYGNSQTKIAVVSRHPNEYYTPASHPDQKSLIIHQNVMLLYLEKIRQCTDLNSRILIVRDVLMTTRDAPLLINLPLMGLPEKSIKTNVDNEILKPTTPAEVAKQIIKTTFSQHSKHQIYEVVGNNPTTVQGLGVQASTQFVPRPTEDVVEKQLHINKLHIKTTTIVASGTQVSPEIIREFVNASKNQETKPKTISLPKAINQPRINIIKPPPIPKMVSVKKPEKKSPKQKQNTSKKTHPITYVILGLLGMLLTSALFSPFVYIHLAQKTVESIKEFDTKTAETQSNYALKIYPLVDKVSLIYLPILNLSGGELSVTEFKNVLLASKIGLNIANQTHQVKELGSEITSHLTNTQKTNIDQKLTNTQHLIKKMYEDTSKIKALIKTIDSKKIPPKTRNEFENMQFALERNLKIGEDVLALMNVMPDMLGLKEQKTYLILLQNNHELRATGGFIGSFALLTVGQGRIIDIETYDVYSADGQLRGHVEPPPALKKYLGEANWYLRDSNWDPNFPTSARRAEWFLNKEMGRQVDGTIGIDLYVVKDMLNIMGGVELPDYNEIINGDNLFERAEYHSELNYFSGSTQKKDFLSALINAMYIKITENKAGEGIKTILSLVENSQKSHLQISMRDDVVETILSDTAASGKVVDSVCGDNQESCVDDYFGVVESNVGVNKVNYFIKRMITKQTVVNPEHISSSINLFIQNTAESAAWPAGNYKNYVRFVLPKDSSIENIRVEDQAISTSSIDVEIRHGKKYVGFYLEVPINQQKVATVNYQLKKPTSSKDSFIIETYFEKQSGTSNDQVFVEVKNNTSQNLWDQNNVKAPNNQVKITTTNITDQEFTFKVESE